MIIGITSAFGPYSIQNELFLLSSSIRSVLDLRAHFSRIEPARCPSVPPPLALRLSGQVYRDAQRRRSQRISKRQKDALRKYLYRSLEH